MTREQGSPCPLPLVGTGLAAGWREFRRRCLLKTPNQTRSCLLQTQRSVRRPSARQLQGRAVAVAEPEGLCGFLAAGQSHRPQSPLCLEPQAGTESTRDIPAFQGHGFLSASSGGRHTAVPALTGPCAKWLPVLTAEPQQPASPRSSHAPRRGGASSFFEETILQETK